MQRGASVQNPEHKVIERLRIVENLVSRVGLHNPAASEICRHAAMHVGSDACLMTLASTSKQHIIGAYGMRTHIPHFDRRFDDEAMETSFFEVLDLPGHADAATSPLVNGSVDAFRSMITTPLFYEGNVVGEMYFFFRSGHQPFTEYERREVLAEKRKAQAFLTAAAE